MSGFFSRFASAARNSGTSDAIPSSVVRPSIKDLLDAAVSDHQRGSFEDAEAGYRQVLAQDPQNPDALYLLGVLALQKGNCASARDLIGQSIVRQPSNVNAHINLAAAEQALGRVAQAEASLRQAISLDPGADHAYNNLGVLLVGQSRGKEAHACFLRAHELSPENTEVLNNLANSFKDRGEFAGAEELYRKAISLKPGFAEAHNNLGSVLTQRGDEFGAEEAYRGALALRPDYAEAWNNLGVLHQTKRRFEDAEQCFWTALEHQSDLVDALSNLGDVLQPLGRLEEAESCCRRALALRTHDAEALNNLAGLLKKGGRPDEAENLLNEAIAHHPRHARSYVNLATLQNLRDLDAAKKNLHIALEIDPGNAPAKYNMATIMLLQGEYAEGFALYESRYGTFTREFSASRGLYEVLKDLPRWQGEQLAGQRLLVWTEQGFGDSLMMMRYLPMLKALGAGTVTVACDNPLRRVMLAMNGVDDVTSSDDWRQVKFDGHCSIMSLAHLFGTTFDSIPSASPYLNPQTVPSSHWKARLSHFKGKKVGVAWAGSKHLADDTSRSIAVSELTPLFQVEGISWISLQKGDTNSPRPDGSLDVADLMDGCLDFMDTAGLIDCLDLVITVDTAVAHLAGALGKPVWLLNRYRGDWRWGLLGDRTPWYSSMRIFRQRNVGGWSGVIEQVTSEVRGLGLS